MNLLREYVRILLQEAAISASDAASQGLALIKTHYIDTELTLFNAEALLEMIKSGEIRTGADIHNNYEKIIVGAISINPSESGGECYGAEQISYPVAIKGYGPLLYDFALHYSKALMPDRSGTSHSAQQIWKFYDQNRGDVQSAEFDDVQNPKTPPKEDDCKIVKGPDFLNKAYSGYGQDPSPLFENTEDFFDELRPFLRKIKIKSNNRDYFASISDIKTAITRAGSKFFASRHLR